MSAIKLLDSLSFDLYDTIKTDKWVLGTNTTKEAFDSKAFNEIVPAAVQLLIFERTVEVSDAFRGVGDALYFMTHIVKAQRAMAPHGLADLRHNEEALDDMSLRYLRRKVILVYRGLLYPNEMNAALQSLEDLRAQFFRFEFRDEIRFYRKVIDCGTALCALRNVYNIYFRFYRKVIAKPSALYIRRIWDGIFDAAPEDPNVLLEEFDFPGGWLMEDTRLHALDLNDFIQVHLNLEQQAHFLGLDEEVRCGEYGWQSYHFFEYIWSKGDIIGIKFNCHRRVELISGYVIYCCKVHMLCAKHLGAKPFPIVHPSGNGRASWSGRDARTKRDPIVLNNVKRDLFGVKRARII